MTELAAQPAPSAIEALGLVLPEPEAPPPEVEEPAAAASPPAPEEPWTPERLKTEREKFEAERKAELKKAQERHKGLEKRDAHLAKKVAEYNAVKREVEALKAAHEASVQALRRGDARTIIAELSRLTGRDGVEVYRELGEALASDGTAGKRNELDELRKEIAELKAERQRETEEARTHQAIQQALGAAVQDAARWDTLAKYSAQVGRDVAVREVHGYMQRERAAGRYVTVANACDAAELALRKASWQPTQGGPDTTAPAAAGANTGAGPDHSAGMSPENAGRSVVSPPGQSVSPTAATRSLSATRSLDPEERERAQVKLIPGIMRDLGLM